MKLIIPVIAVFLSIGTAFCLNTERPLLGILTDTKQVRDGLPVLALHPETARISRELSRGLPAAMLRLYRSIQVYQDPKTAPEPAYLLFSLNQDSEV